MKAQVPALATVFSSDNGILRTRVMLVKCFKVPNTVPLPHIASGHWDYYYFVVFFFQIYSFLRLSTADLPAHEQHPCEHMPSSYLLKTRDTSTCQQNVLALARRKSLFNSELLNTATADLNLFAMTSQLSAVTFLSSCSNKASSAGACGTASASDSSYLGGSGNVSPEHTCTT